MIVRHHHYCWSGLLVRACSSMLLLWVVALACLVGDCHFRHALPASPQALGRDLKVLVPLLACSRRSCPGAAWFARQAQGAHPARARRPGGAAGPSGAQPPTGDADRRNSAYTGSNFGLTVDNSRIDASGRLYSLNAGVNQCSG